VGKDTRGRPTSALSFFSLNYTNYSDYLAGLPVPGIDYVYSPSDTFTLVLGFPFNSLEWKPVEKLTIQLTYLPVRTVKARLTYELFRPLRIYAGFDWDHDSYLRAEPTVMSEAISSSTTRSASRAAYG
jgi:hypothetical protein